MMEAIVIFDKKSVGSIEELKSLLVHGDLNLYLEEKHKVLSIEEKNESMFIVEDAFVKDFYREDSPYILKAIEEKISDPVFFSFDFRDFVFFKRVLSRLNSFGILALVDNCNDHIRDIAEVLKLCSENDFYCGDKNM